MRGHLFRSLLLVCALGTALAGCVSTSVDDLATKGDGLSVVGEPAVGRAPVLASPAGNAAPSQANSFSDADVDTAVSLAEGIPYVRSEPHKVPPFPLAFNGSVQRYVDAFVQNNEGIKRSFRRSRPYLPAMVKVLEKHDLPPDLVYLSFAESLFSSKGAGPWQLSVATARRFNLRVNRYVDERRDPIKSTRAAAKYLATLHYEVGDWRVALVGWNRGESAMDDYWSLRGVDYSRLTSRVPHTTRALFNRFMAMAIIAHQPERYGLEPVNYTEPVKFRTIKVKGGTRLSEVARRMRVSLQALRECNPALLHNRVPPGPSYELRLPLQETADVPAGATIRF